MKKFFNEFKKFISRGNIVDLAVAVIIGSAFSAIVTAFTNKIIMPLINYLLSFGAKDGLASAFTFLKKVVLPDGTIDLASSIYIDWGAFITAVLNFFIIAFTLFLIVKTFNASRKYLGEVTAMSKKENRAIYKQLKQKAKEEKRKFKEVKLEYEAELARIAKEEKEAAEAAEKLAHPGEEALLMEIRNLLLNNQANNLQQNNQQKSETEVTTKTNSKSKTIKNKLK